MSGLPIVIAEIVFLTEAEGGRRLAANVGYRPHIVVQDRSIRSSTVDERGMGNEEYLGVMFTAWPDGYVNGASSEFQMELWYHPRVDYAKAIPGATFTIREGGRIVGHGVINSRELN
ncbi:hypothetical protein [Lacipirellula sp.]|uniref:hypothetical protein n=1 Tax=Lacipirellula sp. TaxID=2691419 RepID=UPI003D0AEE8C